MYTGSGPCRLFLAVLAVSSVCFVAAFRSPRSECYALDKDNYLYDFTDYIGREFKHKQDGSTYTLRFCKDVQEVNPDQSIVNFGRYSPAYTSARDEKIQFVQEYRYGDLKGCEKGSYDYSGRGTQVSIMCAECPDPFECEDPNGCICSVQPSKDNPCLYIVLLGLKCVPKGPHVFEGFTVGFSPRGKEVVDNGITQWGYDNSHTDYSFATKQSRVNVYFTAQSILANLIGNPTFEVVPDKGLKVQLSSTPSNGLGPTVESPTFLEISWRCEKTAPTPYLVNVTIPVAGYDPVVFTLSKHCDYKEDVEKTGSNGWATFGVLSFIVIFGLTMFCCAGFLYKTRIEDKHGLDALPGFTAFTSCIESASGDHSGYAPANDVTNLSVSHNGSSGSSRGPSRGPDGTSYGAV